MLSSNIRCLRGQLPLALDLSKSDPEVDLSPYWMWRPRCDESLGSHSAHLEQLLSGTEVGVLVSLGLGRKRAVGGPQVNQRLHGFEFMGPEHIEGGGSEDKVAEAAVELLFQI